MSCSFIEKNFQAAHKLLESILSDKNFINKINNIIRLSTNCYQQSNKLLICGNGGSMCDADHCAEELTGRFKQDRPPLPAISLSSAAHISCVANDYGYEHIFARSVEALGRPGDLLIALSTSGNSTNVINAVNKAKSLNITTIGLLGKDGGELKSLVDHSLIVPSNSTERIQEIHIKIIHNLIEGIERALFPHLY